MQSLSPGTPGVSNLQAETKRGGSRNSRTQTWNHNQHKNWFPQQYHLQVLSLQPPMAKKPTCKSHNIKRTQWQCHKTPQQPPQHHAFQQSPISNSERIQCSCLLGLPLTSKHKWAQWTAHMNPMDRKCEDIYLQWTLGPLLEVHVSSWSYNTKKCGATTMPLVKDSAQSNPHSQNLTNYFSRFSEEDYCDFTLPKILS